MGEFRYADKAGFCSDANDARVLTQRSSGPVRLSLNGSANQQFTQRATLWRICCAGDPSSKSQDGHDDQDWLVRRCGSHGHNAGQGHPGAARASPRARPGRRRAGSAGPRPARARAGLPRRTGAGWVCSIACSACRMVSRVVDIRSSVNTFGRSRFWRPKCGPGRLRPCTAVSRASRREGNISTPALPPADALDSAGQGRIMRLDQSV